MDDVTARRAAGAAFLNETNPAAAAALAAALNEIAPDLMDYALEFPFGEVYARPGLERRDRQIAVLAALAARGDAAAQLKVHVGVALSLGLTRREIAEVFIQLAPYCGFPTAINAMLALKDATD